MIYIYLYTLLVWCLKDIMYTWIYLYIRVYWSEVIHVYACPCVCVRVYGAAILLHVGLDDDTVRLAYAHIHNTLYFAWLLYVHVTVWLNTSTYEIIEALYHIISFIFIYIHRESASCICCLILCMFCMCADMPAPGNLCYIFMNARIYISIDR